MKNLEKKAMGIVNQLFDLAEVPVDKRQEINDVAYDYVTEQLIIHDVGGSEAKLKFNEFVNKQQDLDGEFVKIVNDNFWDLL